MSILLKVAQTVVIEKNVNMELTAEMGTITIDGKQYKPCEFTSDGYEEETYYHLDDVLSELIPTDITLADKSSLKELNKKLIQLYYNSVNHYDFATIKELVDFIFSIQYGADNGITDITYL